MPIIKSVYNPILWFKSMDISSIYASKFRKIPNIKLERSRLELLDGDFLDIDWIQNASTNTIVILLHGLEGSSNRPYILNMAYKYQEMGINVCCVNYRGCSGMPNKLFRTYHSGEIDDLQCVIDEVLSRNYKKIILHGFSLGGNLSLFYAGKKASSLNPEIKAVIAISAPCDLKECSKQLELKRNIIYSEYFRRSLVAKLYEKIKYFPDKISVETIKSIKTLYDFDTHYTSKAHGFADAEDYYQQCSSFQYLQDIKIPTFILNAKNDSFLNGNCYPYDKAQNNDNLYLEAPVYGGHVAFIDSKNYYSEKRAIEFLQQHEIIK